MSIIQATGETELRWPFLMYDIPAVVVDDMEASVSRWSLFVKGELLVPYCEFANQIPNANFARKQTPTFMPQRVHQNGVNSGSCGRRIKKKRNFFGLRMSKRSLFFRI